MFLWPPPALSLSAWTIPYTHALNVSPLSQVIPGNMGRRIPGRVVEVIDDDVCEAMIILRLRMDVFLFAFFCISFAQLCLPIAGKSLAERYHWTHCC